MFGRSRFMGRCGVFDAKLRFGVKAGEMVAVAMVVRIEVFNFMVTTELPAPGVEPKAGELIV